MLLNLGNLELEAGEVDRAVPILDEAARVFRAQMIMRGWAWPACTLAEALITASAPDRDRARTLLAAARDELSHIRDERGLAQVAGLAARLARDLDGSKAGLDAG